MIFPTYSRIKTVVVPKPLRMKILVIEDEPDMLQTIVRFLTREKYLVETATTFAAAQEKIHLYAYDCILLDITLPGGSGLALLEELKKQPAGKSVIIISARDSPDDKIAGLEAGADDNLAKPFHLAESAFQIPLLSGHGPATFVLSNGAIKKIYYSGGCSQLFPVLPGTFGVNKVIN